MMTNHPLSPTSTRSLTAYNHHSPSASPTTLKFQANRPRKISNPSPSPPAILPKPSVLEQHSRLKRTSPSPTVAVFKETLHASLSQDDIDTRKRRLNQYLLIKTIGKGSFGTVELAQDTANNTFYAIKEYSKSRMRKLLNHKKSSRNISRALSPVSVVNLQIGIELVKHEVAIMKKLHHPNIVSLLEVIDTDQDSLFFVLELCQYGAIQPCPTTPEKICNLFRQIITGIEYLHFNQVIHRDIKPENILYFQDPLLFEDPLIKIVDFGVSESFAKPGDDRMHKSAGSPAFLAPEAWMGIGEGVHGRNIDIWAMGITLYLLVCGKLPFDGHNQIELGEKIINDVPDYPAHLSDSLLELLERLLTKDPTKRIQMNELRVSKWVTQEDTNPLESQISDLKPIEPPTEREIAEAFKTLKSIATMFKAIGKFRRAVKTKNSSSTTTTTTTTTTTSMTTSTTMDSLVSPRSNESSPSRSSNYDAQLVESPTGSLNDSLPTTTTTTSRNLGPELISPLRQLTFDDPPVTTTADSSFDSHNDLTQNHHPLLLLPAHQFHAGLNLSLRSSPASATTDLPLIDLPSSDLSTIDLSTIENTQSPVIQSSPSSSAPPPPPPTSTTTTAHLPTIESPSSDLSTTENPESPIIQSSPCSSPTTSRFPS
ncbi:CAMKK/CAMKK-META protein kinase [Puccinia striiformis f. sp. tritici PST-78]|uniref:CAMKK/CAMKK-META protein kinase n=1 Tax=Puccinia striiformis f. sp. tritici PST-78 TaxID=1165861 RepID=A0A0L0VR85_9BASI|nr:CAMKK/CAMKK-META protein kinase [Puccinia striiformis f. sp. tritici PST-78]